MADANVWGVSVDDVSALAPHIVIADDPAEPAVVGPGDPYNKPTIRKVTRAQVEAFIADISAQVDLRLYRLGKIADTAFLERVKAMAQDVITNGAAWYLVAAAFPVKAGPNENTNYSAELKARFKEGLDALVATVDAFIKAGDGLVAPADAIAGGIRGFFHAPIFSDDMRF